MEKQELKAELLNNTILEFSNNFDIYEIKFSNIRKKYLIRKNGALIKTTESFTNLLITIPFNKLQLTDKF